MEPPDAIEIHRRLSDSARCAHRIRLVRNAPKVET